ncbi:hypothetical protein [Spirosoma gilvum]
MNYSPLGVLCEVLDPNGWDRDGYFQVHRSHYTSPDPELLQLYNIPLSLAERVRRLDYDCMKSAGFIARFLERRYRIQSRGRDNRWNKPRKKRRRRQGVSVY